MSFKIQKEEYTTQTALTYEQEGLPDLTINCYTRDSREWLSAKRKHNIVEKTEFNQATGTLMLAEVDEKEKRAYLGLIISLDQDGNFTDDESDIKEVFKEDKVFAAKVSNFMSFQLITLGNEEDGDTSKPSSGSVKKDGKTEQKQS